MSISSGAIDMSVDKMVDWAVTTNLIIVAAPPPYRAES